MFLFPVDGIMEIILSYGQTISLFLVFVIMEGMIAAKSESKWPGLIFIGVTLLMGVAFALMFGDIAFFYYMLVPAVLSVFAYIAARKNRAKNIAKGMTYNKDGLLKEEMEKMEKGE
ncbi:MAG: hypothetical protein IKT73_01825 [Anaerotignum sp.]|nr:hypothetical protein [Anaerotignum sp.]MBR5590444.1 hypothetical protein [Anaerotignum sp.]MBR6541924.1 hypothetical protein [Anaerotignum sp.]